MRRLPSSQWNHQSDDDRSLLTLEQVLLSPLVRASLARVLTEYILNPYNIQRMATQTGWPLFLPALVRVIGPLMQTLMQTCAAPR